MKSPSAMGYSGSTRNRIQYSTTIHKNRSPTGANPHHASPTQTRSMYVTAKPCGGRPPTCRMRWELPSTLQVHLTGGGNLGAIMTIHL
eukprot:scaffold32262_cov65-Skeletonema_dohrnii-CCMP3373.AAC.1